MTDEPFLLAALIACCLLLVGNLVGLIFYAVNHLTRGRWWR